MIPYMISNIASGLISMEYGFGGPNMSIVTACATSNHNIGEAWRIMKFGDADVMVCGGAEATILPTGVSGFSNMKALSSRNDEPQRASRPYDVDRDGFVMGEGSGVVILETLEHAQKRGAKIYGELVGYGISADAHHLTAPDPEGRGAARCMQMALEHAGMKPEDIDYINTHGTSTPLGDICEIKAIKAVLWRPRQKRAAHQLHQIHDRPPSGRRRRPWNWQPASWPCRKTSSRPPSTWTTRTRNATWIACPTRPARPKWTPS